jgi:hypothetical protein
MMFTDSGVNKIGPNLFQGGERTGLICAHEPGVTDDISSEDGGQAAFHVSLPNQLGLTTLSAIVGLGVTLASIARRSMSSNSEAKSG